METGYWLLAVMGNSRFKDSKKRLLAKGYWQLAAGGKRLLAAGGDGEFKIQGSRIQDSRIRGFEDSRFKDSRIQGFKDSRIQDSKAMKDLIE